MKKILENSREARLSQGTGWDNIPCFAKKMTFVAVLTGTETGPDAYMEKTRYLGIFYPPIFWIFRQI